MKEPEVEEIVREYIEENYLSKNNGWKYPYNQKKFMEFVLTKYIETGIEELDQEKLSKLLTLKYGALRDAKEKLRSADSIRSKFIEFQKFLYDEVSLA